MLGPDGAFHPAMPGGAVELRFRADASGGGLLRLRVGAAGADWGVAGADARSSRSRWTGVTRATSSSPPLARGPAGRPRLPLLRRSPAVDRSGSGPNAARGHFRRGRARRSRGRGERRSLVAPAPSRTDTPRPHGAPPRSSVPEHHDRRAAPLVARGSAGSPPGPSHPRVLGAVEHEDEGHRREGADGPVGPDHGHRMDLPGRGGPFGTARSGYGPIPGRRPHGATLRRPLRG